MTSLDFDPGALRRHITSLQASISLLQLRLVVRGYNPEQPRIPAGEAGGGQWTGGNGQGRTRRNPLLDSPVVVAGGFEKEQLNLTVDKFVAQNCDGRIHRELPGQFYGSTIAEVMADARLGNAAARKCLKILKQDRFRK